MKDRGSNPRWRVFVFFILSSCHLPYPQCPPSLFVWGCSSDGRAFALHARGTGIDTPHLHLFLFFIDSILHRYILPDIFTQKLIQKTTTAGFEPTLPKGNCLAGNRLNHSATLSYTRLYRDVHHTHIPHPIYHTTKTFLKKRQWQDLNLRIQRIIDFKSIALDHSATLSSTLTCSSSLLYLHYSTLLYLHYSTSITYLYLSFPIYPSSFFSLPTPPLPLVLSLLVFSLFSSFFFLLSSLPSPSSLPLLLLPFPFPAARLNFLAQPLSQ